MENKIIYFLLFVAWLPAFGFRSPFFPSYVLRLSYTYTSFMFIVVIARDSWRCLVLGLYTPVRLLYCCSSYSDVIFRLELVFFSLCVAAAAAVVSFFASCFVYYFICRLAMGSHWHNYENAWKLCQYSHGLIRCLNAHWDNREKGRKREREKAWINVIDAIVSMNQPQFIWLQICQPCW